jgi:hypothetical protein
LGIYQIPTEAGGGHLVQPRVIAQTVEIERAVIRIEGGQWSIEKDINQKEEVAISKRRVKISEQQFFDDVTLTNPQKEELRKFFDRSLAIGLFIKPGDNSLMLKYTLADNEYTFGVFRKNGSFQNFGIALVTSGIGHPEIGENYLEGLSVLLKDTYVHKDTNKFQWTVKKKNGQPVPIAECLGVTDKWLQLIEKTIDELNEIQENLA